MLSGKIYFQIQAYSIRVKKSKIWKVGERVETVAYE
jgi:hypothetical protein